MTGHWLRTSTLVFAALTVGTSTLWGQRVWETSSRPAGLPTRAFPIVTRVAATSPGLAVPALGAFAGPVDDRRSRDSAATSVVVPVRGADVVVVRVPVPAAVRLDAAMTLRSVQYRVFSGRHVQLLGASSGALAANRDTALVLAMRVSRRAPAGRTLGGTVEFSIGPLTITVPFELEVAAQRQLSLALSTRSVLATRGRWNTIPLRVVNAGNVDEIASLGVGVPRGWRADIRGRQRTQRLAAGSSSDYQVRVWIPAQENAGMRLLPVRLIRPGERDTTEQVQVDVMADLSSEQRGARVVSSVLGARTADGLSTTAYGISLDGQLSDSTQLSGRLSYADARTLSDSRGMLLARSGLLSGPPSIELRHPKATVQAGATTVLVAELGGQTLSGLGGAVSLSRGRVSLRGYELRPLAMGAPGRAFALGAGSMQGAELGVQTGAVRTSVFTSALREQFTARTLEAHGVRIAMGQFGRTQLSTEIATRRTADTQGIGASTIFQHSGRRSYIEARLVHAPGGSRAFARATNEVSLTGSRALGDRAYVAVGGWRQDDDNALTGAITNAGWSFNPSVSLPRIGTVGVESRGARFTSTIEGTELVNDEISGGGSWSTDIHGTSVVTRSSLARIDRRLNTGDVRTRSEQWRVDHTIGLIRGNAHGVVQTNWSYQQFSAPGGSLPAQQSIQLRVERYRPRLSAPLYFDGDVQRIQVGSAGSAFWAARAAATVELRMGVNVSIAAERSPFAMMSRTTSARAFGYTLRVDRVLGTPRLFSGARNRVFRDDNGNGKLDRGERGVAGVVIQCGTQRVQTDASGRYACADREQRVDARTVPVGLVAAATVVPVGEAVALRVMQPLRIELRMGGSDSLRVRAADFDGAVVFARDTTGAHWYARPLGGGTFVIDAMNVGRYVIGVDASALAEPLTIVGSEPTVQLGGEARPEPIVVELRGRPVKIRTFNATTPAPALPTKAAPVRRLKRAPASLRGTSSPSANGGRTNSTGRNGNGNGAR